MSCVGGLVVSRPDSHCDGGRGFRFEEPSEWQRGRLRGGHVAIAVRTAVRSPSVAAASGPGAPVRPPAARYRSMAASIVERARRATPSAELRGF